MFLLSRWRLEILLGQSNHVPQLNQYLLLMEWGTKLCVWGIWQCWLQSVLITEIRLLFPGIVDNLYWASNPSVYRMYTKLAKIWEANIFQQGTTDNARPWSLKGKKLTGELRSQAALSLGRISPPWYRLNRIQKLFWVEKAEIRLSEA